MARTTYGDTVVLKIRASCREEQGFGLADELPLSAVHGGVPQYHKTMKASSCHQVHTYMVLLLCAAAAMVFAALIAWCRDTLCKLPFGGSSMPVTQARQQLSELQNNPQQSRDVCIVQPLSIPKEKSQAEGCVYGTCQAPTGFP